MREIHAVRMYLEGNRRPILLIQLVFFIPKRSITSRKNNTLFNGISIFPVWKFMEILWYTRECTSLIEFFGTISYLYVESEQKINSIWPRCRKDAVFNSPISWEIISIGLNSMFIECKKWSTSKMDLVLHTSRQQPSTSHSYTRVEQKKTFFALLFD